MSLVYQGSVTNSQGHVSLSIIGDGSSTVLTVDLEDSPLNMDIKSNLPVLISNVSFGNVGSGIVILSSNKKSVTITYDSALNDGQGGNVSFNLYYGGK